MVFAYGGSAGEHAPGGRVDGRERYTEINALSWDKWATEGCTWTVPVSHAEFLSARDGQASVFLTPTRPVPRDWLPDLGDLSVLGLASAGGQQCPIFAAQGAHVTVLDISSEQLASEALVASREGYAINLVQGDMTRDLPFEDSTFDLIFNPVSNSYVEDVKHVWAECHRVLRHGGHLLAGFANPVVYMFDDEGGALVAAHRLPFNPLADCNDQEFSRLAASDGVQFSHTLEEQLGGQLQAGFCLLDMYEDHHPSDDAETRYSTRIGQIATRLTEYTPIYIATRARK